MKVIRKGNIILFTLIGLLITAGCSERLNNDKPEIDSILKNRFNEVLQTIEIKHTLNQEKYEILYSIAIEIYKNSNYIIDNLQDLDKPVNKEVYSKIEQINKIQIEYLGDKRFKRNILLNKPDKLKNRDLRIKAANDLLSDNFYFLSEMLNKEGDNDITFNSFKPVVIEQSDQIQVGQTYTSEIFLAAYDTTQRFIVKIGSNDTLYVDESGKATFKYHARKTGKHEYNGTIIVKKNDGYLLTLPFKEDFYVKK